MINLNKQKSKNLDKLNQLIFLYYKINKNN